MLALLLLRVLLAAIDRQTLHSSRIRFSQETTITVPDFVYVSGYVANMHPSYIVREATIHKPVRKLHEYEYDAERGIHYVVHGDGGDSYILTDSVATGDFSACYLGIATCGVFLAVLFKLFG